jgi:CRISPR-associated endoribonuclease Cas6
MQLLKTKPGHFIMRFLLTLTANQLNCLIPINYQYPFSSWIYKTLNAGNPEFADFLHNNGYTDENKRFKLFCFSNLSMAKYRQEQDRLMLLANPQKLIISFYPIEALEPFIIGLFKNQEFTIGDKISKAGFMVNSVEKLKEPEFSNQMTFKLLSPIHVVRQNPYDPTKTDHLDPEHKDFEANFFDNLTSKYKAYHGNTAFDTSGFKLEILSQPRSKAIYIKQGTMQQSILKSYLFDFKITANAELIRIGYYAGFGKENSQGFGFAEIFK